MVKVKYKDVNDSYDDIVAPDFKKDSNRKSIYSGSAEVVEHYSIDVEKLIPFKNQARKIFSEEKIEELAASIKQHGIRQPLTVVRSPEDDDRYEVVSGERRLRAAESLCLEKIPCIIIREYSDAEEIALIENIQREDLHPLELADALAHLLEAGHGYKQVDLAEKLGVSKQYISELISFSRLPAEEKQNIYDQNITNVTEIRNIVRSKNQNKKDDVGKTQKITRNKSLLRVYLSDDEYKFQTAGLKKLSRSQLQEIKEKISEVIDQVVTE